MIDPITLGVGALVWLAFKKQSEGSEGSVQRGVLTPERAEIFQSAMQHAATEQLRNLAIEFQKLDLKTQAYLLQKRAEWRSRTEEAKKKHAEIFDKAMASENARAILEVAAAFEAMTATVKAQKLRERAELVADRAMKQAANGKSEAVKAPEASEE